MPCPECPVFCNLTMRETSDLTRQAQAWLSPPSASDADRASVTAAACDHRTPQPPRRSRGLLASQVAWTNRIPVAMRPQQIGACSAVRVSQHIAQRPSQDLGIPILTQPLQREQPTPNHALQRTAPYVTAPASGLPPSPPTAQVPRRTPQSLSLGSLGDSERLP